MLELRHGEWTVDVLDPVAEARHLGPRFCGGGYVWQVRQRDGAPLLTGPEWPSANPNPFNGQGLPESFRHRTLAGQPLTWEGSTGVAIGAGELAAAADGSVTLVHRCRWEVRTTLTEIVFETTQSAAGRAYQLSRHVALDGNRLRSTTRLTNIAAAPLIAEWFAHPFFALPADGLVRAELPAGTTLPENPGFALAGRTLQQKRRFKSRDDGHFDHLQLAADVPLLAHVAHPVVGAISFATSFVPSSCVLWGNDRTFSIEPYLKLSLARGETRTWWLEYTFGA